MVQNALPSGTVTNNWNITGAATAHEAVDDPVGSPDDDTTKLDSTVDEDEFLVNIGTVTDPEVGTGHVIRFRCQSTGSGAPERVEVKLFEGTTERAASGNIACNRDTWQDESYTLSEAEANSITDYSVLRLECRVKIIGSELIEVTQIFLEVPDPPVGGASFPAAVNTSVLI